MSDQNKKYFAICVISVVLLTYVATLNEETCDDTEAHRINPDEERHLIAALDELEKQHNNIARTLRAHDIEIRKNCVLIWGIKEHSYESATLIHQVIDFLNDVMQFPVTVEDIDFCFRSKEDRDKVTNHIPMLVRFTTFIKKRKVLYYAEELFIANETYKVENYLNYDDVMMIENEPYFRY